MRQAMAAEEWREFLRPSDRWPSERVEGRTLIVASDCGGEPCAEDVELDAHEVAAMCLHGQPFGFTREDVRRLRTALYAEHYADLADRIEALLPPEDG